MTNRIFILLLLLVALSWTNGYAAATEQAPQHAKIVNAGQPRHASNKKDISHFGVVPEQRQAEEETVTSRRAVDTISSEYAGDPCSQPGSHEAPGTGPTYCRGPEAQIIASDLAAKKLFPFHSFL